MKAVIYARFSPRRNGDACESNETQIELCQAYCNREKYPTGPVFQDRALSGGNEDRPGLWDAVDALGRGDVLVVYKLDRLVRDVYLSCQIERAVQKKGARILSATGEGTWNDSPEDEMIRGIVRVVDQYDRKVKAARTKAAMLRHQRKGRRMSHKLPYGCRSDPNDPARMLKHDGEQAVIQQMVALRRTGAGPRTIASVLAREGIRARNGKKFAHTTIIKILARNIV